MNKQITQTFSRYEHKQHGTSEFPYIIYHSIIPDFIHSYPLHWHDEIELILIQKGNLIITLNKTPLQAAEGDIVLILPGILHAIDRDQQNFAEYYNIIFDLKLLGQDNPSDFCFSRYLSPYLKEKVSLPYLLTKDQAIHQVLHQTLTNLIEAHYHHPQGIELYIKSQLFYIFWLLEPLQCKTQQSQPNQYHISQVQKMKDFLLFIHTNYASSLTLKEAADFCGYSASYFSKFFKSFTGMTLIEYLNNYRLKKASDLLLTTNMNVIEISETIGFENHSYFIRLFRKHYRTTPKQYRNQHAHQSPNPENLPIL